MRIQNQFQPWKNIDLNQPRDVIWIHAESIEDLRLLEKLAASIHENEHGVTAGMTGINKDCLIISIPFK